MVQNENKSFAQRFLFKEIDHLSMLHFIFIFKDKDTAPGGKCIEYIQPNIIYSLFEKFLFLSYFFLLIHLKMFYFISGTNHM